MGGTNVTSSVVTGNKITIPSVTGNIVITAVATEMVVPDPEPVVNLVTSSVSTDKSTVFGYRNNSYASAPHYGTSSDHVVTGFIPIMFCLFPSNSYHKQKTVKIPASNPPAIRQQSSLFHLH